MRTPTCLALLLAAGTTLADEPQLLSNPRFVSTDRVGHIYYNMATREMIRTSAGGARNKSHPVWNNEQFDQCGFGEMAYRPIRDSAIGDDYQRLEFGDIPNNTCVDCITIFYVTDIPDAEEDGEDGFEFKFSLFDGIDSCCDSCSWAPFLEYVVAGLPGSQEGQTAWLLTLDFADLGTIELGDTDGIDNCGSGLNSHAAGQDIDEIPGSDFGFGFHFDHPPGATVGTTGCVLVVPPTGQYPNALGDRDLWGRFSDDWQTFDGFYWSGGYDCSAGPGAWTPWASYFLGLYGSNSQTCFADLNIDGTLDFFDVQAFLNAFAAGDPAADFNHDTLFDFFDLQLFLTQFIAGCP